MAIDISYRADSFGYRIYAETPAGVRAYNELVEQTGSDYIVWLHWPQFKAAIKAAGLTMRKTRGVSVVMNDAELLAELGL